MTSKGTILILLLLVSKVGFSQNGHYPKKITDSTWEISDKQLRVCNTTYFNLKEAREVINLLSDGLDTCKKGLDLADKNNEGLQEIITIQEDAIAERDRLFVTAIETDSKQRKSIKKLTNGVTLWRSSTIVSIILIGILIIL